ncbi:MAG: diaminopimelate decarboxylase [Gammaproteobacteria bacterium]|nr:diaminopimelate decarboxylase [Gammaproteobacteria bacterium]
MSAFQYRDGALHAEDVPLPQLAAAHGTPLYVYARRALTDSWRQFAQPLANTPHQVCYAVKANGTLALLQVLVQLGAGFDIVSGGELARVLRAGGNPGRVVFPGVGKRSDELEQALAAGVGCFNVESGAELERLNALALARKQRAPVALRVNPGVETRTHPHIATGHSGAKFGIELAQVESLALHATGLPGVQLQGLACHVGSQITEYQAILEAATRLAGLADRLRTRGIELAHLDFGGGFPVRYQPDEPLPDVAALLSELRALAETRGLAVRIEPGRAVVAPAGVLLTRVEYLKRTAQRRFAVVDAGMTELIRPALYDAWHEIREVAPRAGEAELCDVVGPVCESADVLGRDRRLAVQPGDLFAIMNAGAYGASMASNYNARPRAAEALVDGAQAHLIRRRETLDDLMAHEILP